jgi:uncharacterized membrane protein
VSDSISEEELLTSKLADSADEKIPFGNRISDKVAAFGGSWKFIIIFLAILFLWILVNSVQLLKQPFDPFPYILMNLILSCIAALQAPVIIMSQNRQEEKDRQRGENDYLINLKAEIEIRHLHQKIDLLITEQFKHLIEIQKVQMESLDKLNVKLDKHLSGK